MADIITTLHPENDADTNLYPNIKRDNIPDGSVNASKLDPNVLSLIGSLKPSGTDTSTNILAFTYNKGIYVATDNGHWYYWNGSNYVDGGVYQAVTINDGSVTYFSLDDMIKNSIFKSKDYKNDVLTYKLLMTDGTLTNSNEETAVVTNDIEVNEGDLLLYSGAWYVNARAGVVGYKTDGTVMVLIGSTNYPDKHISTPVSLTIPSGVVRIKCASNNITQYPLTATLISDNVQKKMRIFKSSSNLLSIGRNLTNRVTILSKNDNESKIESPNVFWDPILVRYGMVYTSYGKDSSNNVTYGVIKYLYSYDLENWIDDDITLLTPNSTSGLADSGSVTAPVMYIENDTYYLFYCGCTEAGYEQGVKTICIATGSSLTNLTRYSNNPIIKKKDGETWYNTDCYHANIVKLNDKYYLFFNALGWAYGYSEHKAESIGYAISNDLFNWNVSDNACLKYSTNNADYDYSIVGDPYVFDIGDDNMYMAYFTYNHVNPQGMHDYLAKCKKSDFPNGWIKTNIKLTTSSFNAKPSIIYHKSKLFHFFGANGDIIGYYYE